MAERRRPVPLPPTPITDAVDRVLARAHDRAAVRLPVLNVPHGWPPDAEVTLQAPDDPAHPMLLVWDPAEDAWRAILLPPGSRWQIHPERSPLWQPGGPQ